VLQQIREKGGLPPFSPKGTDGNDDPDGRPNQTEDEPDDVEDESKDPADEPDALENVDSQVERERSDADDRPQNHRLNRVEADERIFAIQVIKHETTRQRKEAGQPGRRGRRQTRAWCSRIERRSQRRLERRIWLFRHRKRGRQSKIRREGVKDGKRELPLPHPL